MSRLGEPPRSRRNRTIQRLLRHGALVAISLLVTAVFWATRAEWVPDMRLWKSVGDTAYVLLLVSLGLGPLSRIAPKAKRWLKWRRQFGIWSAVAASIHALLILDGWAEWSVRRFLGYEFVPQLGREARLEPGFGLANLIGLSALAVLLVLAATSSDAAVRRLGRPAWIWLHRLGQTVLILSILHGGYFLFIHFTLSFHKVVPEPDWFRVPFLLAGVSVLALQGVGFVRTLGSDTARSETSTSTT